MLAHALVEKQSSSLQLFIKQVILLRRDKYNEQIVSYTSMYMLRAIKIFNLHKNDKLYATEVGEVVLGSRSLSELDEASLDVSTFDLPYLKMDRNGDILDFDKADAFTPLMYACFNGQLDNVQWLVNQGVNINRQQNRLGNCPLFLALEGYAQAEEQEKKTYINILQFLIRKEANILAHDREDKTFVHKAISILSDKDFKLIMTLISKQDEEMVARLFGYLDQNNLDVMLCSIKNREIAKVRILLDLYPRYFATNFVQVSQSSKKAVFDEFKVAIEDLSDEDKESLIEVLSKKEYKTPKYLIKELTSTSRPSVSMEC